MTNREIPPVSARDYFDNYKERFLHKSIVTGLKATKNWVEGLIKAFRDGTIDFATSEKIEKTRRTEKGELENHRNANEARSL